MANTYSKSITMLYIDGIFIFSITNTVRNQKVLHWTWHCINWTSYEVFLLIEEYAS